MSIVIGNLSMTWILTCRIPVQAKELVIWAGQGSGGRRSLVVGGVLAAGTSGSSWRQHHTGASTSGTGIVPALLGTIRSR